VNRSELFDIVLNAHDNDKILILKMLFKDLNFGNMTKAKDFYGLKSTNGVRKTKETIKLDGKEFTRLL
jgi:hypothetical protein